MDANNAHRRPRKRSRKTKATTTQSALAGSAHIFKLPLELIAEILQYTNSPKDVLAMCRCSKSLCSTLLKAESGFIWRSVRQNCLPGPLPDPQALNLTESAFAALVFDGGHCIMCERATQNMYSSWSLRIRFCSRPECRDSWTNTHVGRITNFNILSSHDRKALAWIPLAESPACFTSKENPTRTWPEADKMYLKSTMEAALAEYATSPSNVVDTRHALDIARSPLKMSFYVTLYHWRHKRGGLERQIKAENETFGKALAEKEGYIYLELLNGSGTYQALHANRNKNLELITRLDYDVVSAQIEAEMISIRDRRERRSDEATIRANRAQVEQHYQRLLSTSRSQVPSAPLPSLSQFRAMPILDLLQRPAAASKMTKKSPGVAHELKSETLVNQLLTSELARWRKGAEVALGATLGLPEWKTARNNKLHPVARLTARWNCGKCGKVGRAYKLDECLDYQGVCKHECTKSKKQSSSWKAEQFVKDDKAVNAMIKLVKLCGIDAEDPGSFAALENIGAQARILCLSCPAAIVMRPSNVPGHSHRHEDMDMSLLSQSDATALVVAPVDKDLAMKLMGHDDFKVKEAQKTWMYGCRHCQQLHPPPVEEKASASASAPEPTVTEAAPTATAPAAPDAPMAEAQPEGEGTAESEKKEKNPKKQPKKFVFDGLRSHLKEKHSIPLPHDEDFYRILEDAAVKAA
ncbi:hypothetical protein C8F04DRAFT_1002688 [Mycena alexandri]|uniref:F-box domain-containing protein n=1 Tax=Mycena alexandri TaxID=1745969 RepID=A0AAD6STG3_9AGAR|nr:hypothetical protein C8F04DRAFT_1002688 [Mycena alexandri]